METVLKIVYNQCICVCMCVKRIRNAFSQMSGKCVAVTILHLLEWSAVHSPSAAEACHNADMIDTWWNRICYHQKISNISGQGSHWFISVKGGQWTCSGQLEEMHSLCAFCPWCPLSVLGLKMVDRLKNCWVGGWGHQTYKSSRWLCKDKFIQQIKCVCMPSLKKKKKKIFILLILIEHETCNR